MSKTMVPDFGQEKVDRWIPPLMPVNFPLASAGFARLIPSFYVRTFCFRHQEAYQKHKRLNIPYRHALWPFLVKEVFHGIFLVGAVSAGVSLAVLTFISFLISEKGSVTAFSI